MGYSKAGSESKINASVPMKTAFYEATGKNRELISLYLQDCIEGMREILQPRSG